MSVYYHEILIQGETLYLLPQKAVYRPAKKQLILSDLHLGKTSHFRKKGIPIPVQSQLKDLDLLHFLLKKWEPGTVLLLGDLFHSDYNREWLWFKSLLRQYPRTRFILVEGNHDILQEDKYRIENLEKVKLVEDEHFTFSHHPLVDAPKINFCGHLHPGIRINGAGKQTERLPCFYFNKKQFILPAFGSLTGTFVLEKEKGSDYYLVVDTKVIPYP